MRFWLERGVDGFRFDTVNYYFHDRQLRSNPPAKRHDGLPYAVNPYDMQEHRYSKNQPENLAFLNRMRALMDEFPGTATVGEIGDSQIGVKLMADYTSDGDKLHMAYSFDMLGKEFDANHFRSRIERVFAAGNDAWPCWSFSNHDVERHVSRWSKHAADPAALAREAIAMLIGMRGTLCLYQGEELGLPETDILFEELTDPPGIRFWPEYKGRDGCRTPIPWDEGRPPNGFTTGRPWLPVKPPQSALNVAAEEADAGSMLHFYRKALAFRRAHEVLASGGIAFIDVAEPLLAFRRTGPEEVLTCLYNLSPAPITVTLTGGPASEPLLAEATERQDDRLTLGANGFAIIPTIPGGVELGVSYTGADEDGRG
jgi:alpha-glucosidase